MGGHLLARMCGKVFKLAWKGSAKVETRFLHSRGSVAVVTGWAGPRDVMQPASSATAGDHVVPLGAKNTQVGTLLLHKVFKMVSPVEAEEWEVLREKSRMSDLFLCKQTKL